MFTKSLVSAFKIPNNFFDINGFNNIIINSWANLDYNPRSIERALTLFTISVSSCRPDKAKELHRQILLLSILKIHAPSIYNDAKRNERIIDELGVDPKKIIVKNLVDYLKKEEYFPPQMILGKLGNAVKIKYLKEAAKIVDIYDLPLSSNINDMSDKEIIDKAQHKPF